MEKLKKIIDAMTWCRNHDGASDCPDCPMWNDDSRPCSYKGEDDVLTYLRSHYDLLCMGMKYGHVEFRDNEDFLECGEVEDDK